MECVGVAVCFRHGARGLVSTSAASLRGHEPGDAHACSPRAWADSEMEHLSAVGDEQMRQLGRWVGRRLVPRLAGGAARAGAWAARGVKWRSSPVPRVVDSGRAALEGLVEEGPFRGAAVPSAPQAYRDASEAEFVFRNWHADPAFLAATRELRRSDGLKQAALKVRSELDALWGALAGRPPPAAAAGRGVSVDVEGGPPPAAAAGGAPSPRTAEAVAAELAGAAATLRGIAADDAPSPSPSPRAAASAAVTGGAGAGDEAGAAAPGAGAEEEDDDDALARRLYQTTYVSELWACEANWPATAVAIRNGLLAPGGDSNGQSAATATVAGPLPPGGVKATLLRRLSPASEAFMRATARWVWEQRFLASPFTKAFGPAIGGALVAEMLGDLAAAASVGGGGLAGSSGSGGGCGGGGAPLLSLYSAHDYSLLSMLAALKVARHPDRCVGFGAFIVLEAWRDGGGGSSGAPGVVPHAAAGPRSRHPGVSVTARICVEPFPCARDGRPSELHPEDCAVLFEGVSLDSLLELAARTFPRWDAALGAAVAAPGAARAAAAGAVGSSRSR